MNSLLVGLFLVAVICAIFLVLVMRGGAKREVEKAGESAREEVLDDIHLRDVVLANDIRDRVADVPDRLPEHAPTEAATKPVRRGRRGPT